MARQPPPISYRATAAELQQLSQLARSLGCSRHFLLRSAVAQFLESQKQITQSATNTLGNQRQITASQSSNQVR